MTALGRGMTHSLSNALGAWGPAKEGTACVGESGFTDDGGRCHLENRESCPCGDRAGGTLLVAAVSWLGSDGEGHLRPLEIRIGSCTRQVFPRLVASLEKFSLPLL